MAEEQRSRAGRLAGRVQRVLRHGLPGIVASFAFLPGSYGQELVYRFDPELGVPFREVTTSTTVTQTRMQGMDLEMTTTVQMEQDVVFEAGSDDTVVGRYTITSLSAEAGGLPGMDQLPFDQNDILQGIVGAAVTLTFARDGRVVEFGGLEELMDAMLEGIDVPDELRAMMSQFAEANFGEEQMQQMFGKSGFVGAGRPVAVGDTWRDSVTVFGMELDTAYTLAERTGGQAVIRAAGSISGTDGAGFEFPGMPSLPGIEMRFENLSGSIDGSFEVDDATGLVAAYSMDTTMDVDMVMEMPEIEELAAESAFAMSVSMQSTVEGSLRRAE